jgi:alpha-beta hydrolase superfamily lysophospholipase
MKITDWEMEGSRGETIYGTTHEASSEPKGVVLMAHGFKGYKDYGMFPWLAKQFSSGGDIVHRFNFSHSGMLDGDGPFERPDLFEQATWNTQVEDLKVLAHALTQENLPLTLFGHSRGGLAALLAVGRGEVDASRVIALSSPSQCISMSTEAQNLLLEQGKIESPSGRTGQMLYVGKAFLEEQLQSPESHDLIALASTIEVPCLIIHGEDDSTVPFSAAVTLAGTIEHATLEKIAGGDHVFNTPNPFPIDGVPSPQLQAVWDSIATK